MAAIAAFLVFPSLASAALKDVGPTHPSTGFPTWYRDTNGTALSLCTEMRPSPNAAAGGSPMCFPVIEDPAGYPGNLGGEVFFFNSSANLLGAGGFSVLWEGAIEATYATGTPIRGDEITFARIRIVMNTRVAGTYKVIHPYGVDVFPNVAAGNRSVFYTVDIGVAPGVFTGALGGAVGPFLEWERDVANPTAPFGVDPVSAQPYSLQLSNPDGSTVQFLGDPNFFHAVQGSPFGTNFVRVEGPPGSNLDGAGNDFIVTNQFAVVGQRYTVPIPVPLNVYRANYSVDGSVTPPVTYVDVFAESVPGAQLIATAENVPTSELSVDPASGEAYSHVEFVAGGPVGAQVTVTNVSDNPHSSHIAPLTDIVTTSQAVLFADLSGATAGNVTIVAESSVHTDPAPTLSIVELPGAIRSLPNPATPWVQRFDATLLAGVTPPWHLTALSTAGGSHYEPIVIGATGVFAPVGPTALPQPLTTLQGVAVSFSAIDPLTPSAAIMVLNPPANGTATVNLDGTITYTPRNLFNGADAFTYMLYVVDPVDPANTKKWVYSNAGHVTVDVAFANVPPTAVTDLATTAPGTPVVINVAANDTDVDGTVVPASVVVVAPPPSGTLVNNGDGTLTYTPSAGILGTVSFTYTIQDNLGGVSAPGTAQVTVAQAEVLTILRAEWTVSKARWRIEGTSSVFGPGVANTVTVRIGLSPNLGARIGTPVPIDALGNWAVDVADPALTLDATNSVTAISTGGGSRAAAVARK